MKKFIIIILGILLVGCCAANEQNSNKGSLIVKTLIKSHHSENCKGHEDLIQRIDFEQEGHDMWMFTTTGGSVHMSIIHSPNCRKCNSDNLSVLEQSNPTETSSDYWGW